MLLKRGAHTRLELKAATPTQCDANQWAHVDDYRGGRNRTKGEACHYSKNFISCMQNMSRVQTAKHTLHSSATPFDHFSLCCPIVPSGACMYLKASESDLLLSFLFPFVSAPLLALM
jgi:hypothetical protein